MKERKLGLAKRLSAMALALVMVFSLLSLSDLKALAAGDTAPTASDDWTYDAKDHDLIVAPGQALDDAYTIYYAVTETNDEPNAPTASNLGEWTINWRADDRFLVTDAGDYYLWWCAYDAEEDEFSTEPELFDMVTVEKATPLGVAPTGVSKEWDDGAAQSLIEFPGGIPLDPAHSEYKYAITSADEDDPTDYQWGTYADGMTALAGGNTGIFNASSVGDYKIWYQLKADGTDKNIEDAEIGYVEASITAKAMYVANEDDLEESFAGETTDPVFDQLAFADSDGAVHPTIIYAAKKNDLTSSKTTDKYTNINDAFKAVAYKNNKYKAGTYTVWYMATLSGYETTTGSVDLELKKAQALFTGDPTIQNVKILGPSDTAVQLIDSQTGVTTSVDPSTAATDSAIKMYYQVNQSGKMPSNTSLSGWTTDYASLKKGEGKWYVFYMAATSDMTNIAASPVEYQVITVGKNGADLQSTTIDTYPTGANVTYNGSAQAILTQQARSASGGTIQYYVSENVETMPAPNADGWYALGETETINKTKAGEYYVWYRVLSKTSGTTTYAETTPVLITGSPVTIGSKNASIVTPPTEVGTTDDGSKPVAVTELTYTGRSQYLVEPGTGKNGLYWYYIAYNSDDEVVYMGTSAPKLTKADTYNVRAFLVDPSYNLITTWSNYNAVYNETYGLAVADTWDGTVTIAQYNPEITDPELVDDDLAYTGSAQSLIAKNGKSDKGNLYYFVVNDETQKIESYNGTATEAGDYSVYAVATDLTEFEVAMAVAKANLAGPYLRKEFNTMGFDATNLALATEGASLLGVSASGLNGDSNIWIDGNVLAEGSVTIETVEPTVLGVLPVETGYTGHAQDIALEGLTNGGRIYYMAYDEGGDEVWDEWTRIVPRATEIGKYTIAYRVDIPDWETNFEPVEEIKLEEPSVITEGQAELLVAPVGLGLNATGLDQALVEEGLADNGTIMYALGTEEAPYPGVEWKAEVPEASEEGTYHVWYYVAGNEGFADTDPAHVDAVIGQETTLYRIFNPATGEHIYTYDANEVANATQNLGWSLDGTVSGTTAGTKPVYRLMDLIHGVHIYSTDDNEVQTLVAAGVAQLEGVQFYTVPQAEGTDDYYRLSSPDFPHHYTNDWNEINSLVESGVYTLDGYAWSFPQ